MTTLNANSNISGKPRRSITSTLSRILCAALLAFAFAPSSHAQLDFCGCSGLPGSLGAFDTRVLASYPPGTISQFRLLRIPLPPDGVLVFDSFTLNFRTGANGTIDDAASLTVDFVPNAANTPVTILVKGNVTIGGAVTLNVNGSDGVSGTTGINGVAGRGGPGGFRGGDGAYQIVNFASIGGAGLGPGGGAGATSSPFTNGGAASFVGIPELLPLVGGSGGGGGASLNNTTNASGGGGGGGGGAILLAANGTITVSGTISADGGNSGSPNNGSFASYGHGGSGGAIRLVAKAITGGGSLFARGGFRFLDFQRSSGGRIRMESLTNDMSSNNTDPVAGRAPGPIINPFTPTVHIDTIGGQTPPAPPQGVFGQVDVVLPAPGPTSIVFSTTGVPIGTIVKLTLKPRVGSAPIIQNFTLGGPNSIVDATGHTTNTVVIDLQAGAYTIEAQATLQVQ